MEPMLAQFEVPEPHRASPAFHPPALQKTSFPDFLTALGVFLVSGMCLAGRLWCLALAVNSVSPET